METKGGCTGTANLNSIPKLKLSFLLNYYELDFTAECIHCCKMATNRAQCAPLMAIFRALPHEVAVLYLHCQTLLHTVEKVKQQWVGEERQN